MIAADGGNAPRMVRGPLTKEEEAALEVDNGFRQYARGEEVIQFYLQPAVPFALRPSLIKMLQSIAVEGLLPNPGQYRAGPVGITKSDHVPPDAHLVPSLVEEMCDYVNDNLHERTSLHLAAYVLWRLNWIHPFEDGNGRTSRVTSYIVLNVTLGYELPGNPPIPQQIQDDRTAYFEGLTAADAAWKRGELDLSAMEGALRGMLAKQLLSVVKDAGGLTDL